MKTRRLGKTDLTISEIGFGCGGFWGLPIFSEDDAKNLILTAIENGVTFFDTGSNYSNGNAESRLGKILNGINDKVIIATKIGSRYSNGKNYKDFSKEGMQESLKNSLKNLKTDCIPLLQLHGLPAENEIDDVIDFLLKIKREGLVRYIGASCDNEDALKIISYRIFDTLMITYNIMEKKSADIIKSAASSGMGVIIKSPMAHALYDNIFKIKGFRNIWYILRILKNYRRLLYESKRYKFINNIDGWTSHEVALKYVLMNSDISCAVIGTNNVAHLIENIRVSDKKDLDKSIYKILTDT